MSNYNSYNTSLMVGNPCRRDCPERKPGCNCEKRKEWRKEYEAKKETIYRDKNNTQMIDGVIATGKSRRKK